MAAHVAAIETLFDTMNKKLRAQVAHKYNNGFQMHNYYLGCVDRRTGRAGLLSNDWKRCYRANQIRRDSSVETSIYASDDFKLLFADDKELQKAISDLSDIRRDAGEAGVNAWTTDYKEATCFQYSMTTISGRIRTFCLHSIKAAESDIRYKYGMYVAGTLTLGVATFPLWLFLVYKIMCPQYMK